MPTEYLNNKIFERIIGQFQQAKRDHARFQMIRQDFADAQQRLALHNKTFVGWELDVRYDGCVDFFNESQKDLAIAFYTLSENIVRYAKFNLIDPDDAIQEGVMICFEKIDRFDPRKGKAFNYMTTCILNHFRQLYRTARNYNELKKKYHSFLQTQFEYAFLRNKERAAKNMLKS